VARKAKTNAPRILICEVSGREFEYLGFGRPPRFHPDVAKDRAKQRRAAAYEAKQAAKGKSVRKRAA
jgi:hypothetical protein